MTEEYSKLHLAISFCHILPGLVNTPGWNVTLLWIRPLLAIAKLVMISPEERGQRMLAALLKPEYKTGGFVLDAYGNEAEAGKGTPEVRKQLAEHYRTEVAV
ncbi:hypothetical protein FRC01_011858 [Tulasnella sp. 417]|nr:hypothetical protein FRC01_011858 [Tulasnella sp. 417]